MRVIFFYSIFRLLFPTICVTIGVSQRQHRCGKIERYDMKLLAIGDIMAPAAVDYLCTHLPQIRRQHNIDLVVANGENASFLGGIGEDAALKLLDHGVDIITGGNHTMQTRTIYPLLEKGEQVLRPINFPTEVVGYGSAIVTAKDGTKVLVVNAMGTNLIEPILDSPIPHIEKTLARNKGDYSLAVMDFHAEATGEKLAIAHMFGSHFAAIWGTHTHVPTADEQVLPSGCGFMSDIGATAPTGGILGVKTEVICNRLRTKCPHPYRVAEGPVRAEGAIFDLDPNTNKCVSVARIHF